MKTTMKECRLGPCIRAPPSQRSTSNTCGHMPCGAHSRSTRSRPGIDRAESPASNVDLSVAGRTVVSAHDGACIGERMIPDWFHLLMGFREESYDFTRERLRVEGDELVSTANDKRYGIGSLTVPTLDELRSRIEVPDRGRSTVRCVTGDA